jgi:hypothetical protein
MFVLSSHPLLVLPAFHLLVLLFILSRVGGARDELLRFLARMIGCIGTSLQLHLVFNWYSAGGVQLGPLGTASTNSPILPAPGDYDDGEIGGMIGKGNRSTRRKPAPVPLCPPQTPHAARTRTRVAAMGSQRLTA